MEEHWTEALITKAFEQKKRVDSSINQEQNEDFYDAGIILSSTDNYFTKLFWKIRFEVRPKKSWKHSIRKLIMQLWEYGIRIIIWKWSSKRRNMIPTFLYTCEQRWLGHEDPSITIMQVVRSQMNEKNRGLTLDSISLSLHSRNNMSPRLTEIGQRRGWKRKSKRKKENWLLLFHLTEKQLQ